MLPAQSWIKKDLISTEKISAKVTAKNVNTNFDSNRVTSEVQDKSHSKTLASFDRDIAGNTKLTDDD